MKQFISRFGGIIIGSLYGLLFRLSMGREFGDHKFTDLFSITFIWIVPIIIGTIPMLFATKERLASNSYRLGAPVLTVFLFFIYCFITRIEDLICIIIIASPFLLGAAVGGYVFARVILHHRKKKGILYSIFLLPLLTGLLEGQLPAPAKTYEIRTPIRINAPAAKIWENVIRVKEIREDEYSKGFFHYAGIPRPLFAELNKDTVAATRTGHFEGGLTFRETVTHWERHKKVSFSIEVIPGTIRNAIFDQHILKGNHFRFLNASYELECINDQETELTLICSYQLTTRVNAYGSFWGNTLLTDFQERLLAVIKQRCDE
ncbi:hypothetical protein HB364_08920 [Pseudoflavitalea sp. X16]|uniref:hypothetical protein n=1 Tax=Paraflavitalea devenefica TaxID=2716334 RepID=UPI001421901E|nr:hypothetical protein [Paraflavitalea devenefica]NII25200.1 hypothetical protein [Paraflavitalea devenefica]